MTIRFSSLTLASSVESCSDHQRDFAIELDWSSLLHPDPSSASTTESKSTLSPIRSRKDEPSACSAPFCHPAQPPPSHSSFLRLHRLRIVWPASESVGTSQTDDISDFSSPSTCSTFRPMDRVNNASNTKPPQIYLIFSISRYSLLIISSHV